MKAKLPLLFIIVLFISACAYQDVNSYIVPTAGYDKTQPHYLIVDDSDTRGVYKYVADELKRAGVDVSYGTEHDISKEAKYIVKYDARWQWDMTWYLLEFSVNIYEPKNDLLVATASSLRSSLVRKEARDVVSEAISKLYGHPGS